MVRGLLNRVFFLLLATSHLVGYSNAVYTWPNPTMDELEHILVDNEGFNDAGFKRAITPCTNYIQGPQTLGRQTSAQWLRVAFHDFSTANVPAGAGGIDASIGFETLRPENSGSAMNDSLSFFAPFVNAHVSMADLIALSVSLSIGSCSSPTITIPLRGGRIDATEGGEFGVPEPETSIEETLHQFEHAGFNQADAIGLTACGHTMGNVHHGGFPQVVPESAVTPNNTGGGIHFDSTPDVFDINVVQEYLASEGNRGGALVTTDNVTVRSDLRLYVSDNNATIARPFHPVNVTLDFTSTGEMRFRGFIRLLSSTSSNVTPEVQVSWQSREGFSSRKFSTSANFEASGASTWGSISYFKFDAPIDLGSGISKFFVAVDGRIHDNGGSGHPVQDSAFVVPSLTNVDDSGNFELTAAVLNSFSSANVRAELSFPAVQLGTISPKIVKTLTSLASFNKNFNSEYSLYRASGAIPLSNLTNSNQVSADLITATGDRRIGTVHDNFRRLKQL
ncbi:hypothetical protein E1B28_010610 [Marasmius oreades]|uniref:Peroxidase n=1 Tax=Marasmius oreades TaxID=181124 RepID=A0A9P7RXL6_9AGAR|nr:uncharacterized protein E1B28_010610 [Marasmius oreades]KAG7091589.1 hypothetical protein E1B28_010610 [Marasmius oreades]